MLGKPWVIVNFLNGDKFLIGAKKAIYEKLPKRVVLFKKSNDYGKNYALLLCASRKRALENVLTANNRKEKGNKGAGDLPVWAI